ncbi:amidohydrolase family protein [Lutibacter citreus]|uniref:hypothetical protein n=1 Tax=Lutibacter citreus TaxID=2138210 RepID=UPI000DBE3DE9|nr:hypothetical protein [Lutibacter citreus]
MSLNQPNTGLPFINAHTHTFTKEHVPKYMAKQILPWPFYKWFPTIPIVNFIKSYLKRNNDDFGYTGRNKKHLAYQKKKFRTQTPFKILYFVWLTVVWLIFAYYLFELIVPSLKETWIGWLCNFYIDLLNPIMPDLGNLWNSVFLLLFIVIAFKSVRSMLIKYLWSRFQKAIGKEQLELLLRYINIARFTSHSGQAYIFNQLKQQYPAGSKFVILPMDLQYMEAGPVRTPFLEQMKEVIDLKKIKDNQDVCYPFIFVDPRRIKEYGKVFLNLNSDDPDNIILEDCQLKTYIDGGCAGIKIYPALGYYVFDKNLLKLWLYCQQKNIPITTHCSIGPVYYRGKLNDLGKNYDYHPIFNEVYEKNEDTKEKTIGQLRFLELKNKDFQKNFTHPLNYLCLLHEPLLTKVIETFDENGDLKTLFGYKDGKITRNLKNLKINLAHYGSAEMWERFLSKDRYREANAIIQNPKNGLNLKARLESNANLYQFWHYVDWFSIISTMIMQFENVYTDISYTSHDLKYLNLLSEILDNPKIGKRVLFGTDFYVVSNHKTEKQYWIDMQNSLGAIKWNLIAKQNPTEFLKSKLASSL